MLGAAGPKLTNRPVRTSEPFFVSSPQPTPRFGVQAMLSTPKLNHPSPMAHLFLAIFLIVFGLNIIVGLSIPMWVIGILALAAGLLLVMEHFRVRVDRKVP